MRKISTKKLKEINHYRSLFPKQIEVKVFVLKEGGFFGEILTFHGCLTEAETFSELIEMVNDAVYTYFEIPKKYLSFMPTYLPPLSLAQKLNFLPPFSTFSELFRFSQINYVKDLTR